MKYRVISFLIVLLCLPTASHATWSVAKLDKQSKSIVVAGASCSFMVYGIANVVPGKGVAIVQAASSEQARAYAGEQIAAGQSLEGILTRIVDKQFIPDALEQQYALLSFDKWQDPVTYTGDETTEWRGAKSGPGLSVQANTMVSAEVVKEAFDAMSGTTKTDVELARQALAALQAGSAAGGDKRCGEATASSAFVTVFRETDNASMPYLNLVVYGIEGGKDNAVTRLTDLFMEWQSRYTDRKSTQQFVVP
jgi:uncharacterized Ntn-hydrolase superfamily protein